MTVNAADEYIGWLRQPKHRGSRKWLAVCSAPTQAECERLLDLTPRYGACELVVLRREEGPPEKVLKGSRPSGNGKGWHRWGN